MLLRRNPVFPVFDISKLRLCKRVGDLILPEEFLQQLIPNVLQCFIHSKKGQSNAGSAQEARAVETTVQIQAGHLFRQERQAVLREQTGCVVAAETKYKGKMQGGTLSLDNGKAMLPDVTPANQGIGKLGFVKKIRMKRTVDGMGDSHGDLSLLEKK